MREILKYEHEIDRISQIEKKNNDSIEERDKSFIVELKKLSDTNEVSKKKSKSMLSDTNCIKLPLEKVNNNATELLTRSRASCLYDDIFRWLLF